MSFHELFSLLESEPGFSCWYSETLVSSDFEGFFLEFPPLTTAGLEDDSEFVIIDSAAVAGLRADSRPFESQFQERQGSDVITFPNLGADALLIAPVPLSSDNSYPHLAMFLRKAPEKQIRSLWQAVACAVLENLSEIPKWLSTAGLGVSWLHVRLDSRPKYYNYLPYKSVTSV
ncbi:MAG: DUF6940 family protein [Woeseiaceae bacterium]